MKSELLNMIDDQYKSSFVKQLEEEIKMLEKLIELNMKDLWDIADQRDWYYEEYQKLKEKSEQKIPQQKS
jgi:hypothetical protein